MKTGLAVTVAPAVVAFVATLVLTPAVRWLARRVGAVAAPTAQRWHRMPTALFGGIAIYAGFIVAIAATTRQLGDPKQIVPSGPGLGIISTATMMFVVGLIDDLVNFKAVTKLILQLIAAAFLVTGGVLLPLTQWTPVNVVVTIFWFIGLTNALNLLDNMDGVAAGVAGIAASFLAITFASSQAWGLAAVCAALAGSALGFLRYNFHPASIFMGDSGSLFFGAVLAGLAAAYPAQVRGSIASVLFVPCLIVVIPIADTFLVTISRTLAGLPISAGGRDHTSHRLVAMGLSETQVALVLYAFAVCGGLIALLAARLAWAWPVALLFLITLGILAAYLSRLHSYEPAAPVSAKFTVLVSDLLYKRRMLELMVDLAIFSIAYAGAFILRFDGAVPPFFKEQLSGTLAIVVACRAVAFGVAGVYRPDWQRPGTTDALRVISAVLLGTAVAVLVIALVNQKPMPSIGVLIMDALLVLVLAGSARLLFRVMERVQESLRPGRARTLIYGAGERGLSCMRELRSNAELDMVPVGFLDDDRMKIGRTVQGLAVHGPSSDLLAILQRTRATKLVISTRQVTVPRLAHVRHVCDWQGIEVLSFELRFNALSGVGPIETVAQPVRDPLPVQ